MFSKFSDEAEAGKKGKIKLKKWGLSILTMNYGSKTAR